ncbi:ribosome small subunit-dependent GTPase A [Alkalicoccus chagannorensis]|uniref:ribosome small subunit-dependent GTPase A n=1 Tax=Alkalicoccus chagannorensis TaxID=427072 RepID=UPI00040C0814|nr:ribosome small subunit-dependent GTPase A [Alkalicoccus chagannorensis]
MAEGRIIKAISGFYYVENEEGTFQCRGRGNFRKRGISPLVGDWVVFEAENRTDGYVLDVKERQNELIRPPIANIEQALLVFSAKEPDFSPILLDRLLVHTEAHDLDTVICVTKTDLGLTASDEEKLAVYEEIGYPVHRTAMDDEQALQEFRPVLQGKVSVLAGQSGVGKSSLMNQLRPELELETNEISSSLGRGKHTTRHVELLPLPEGGYVADTPGFSSLDFDGIEAETLSHFYPEMAARIQECKFRACTHRSEPKCAVRTAVEDGDIADFRYTSYLQFYDEIANTKRRY